MQNDEINQNERKSKTLFYMKIIHLLKPFYEMVGVNYNQMVLILETKMRMDSRKSNLVMSTSSTKDEKKESNDFLSSLWIYTVLSVFLLVVFFYDNYMYQYTIYFSYLFMMIMATLISQFSTVILDPRDQLFIRSKPVSTVTSSAAKVTHIGIYLVALTVALGAPHIITSFIVNGILVGISVLFLTFIATIWSLILTLVMYAFILRHFDGERMKNLIAYSQIGLSAFMVLVFYFMGDIFSLTNLETLTIGMELQWWNVLLFPLWFVAPFGIIQNGFIPSLLIYTALLIIGTVLLIVMYYMHRDKIDQNLQKIDTSGMKDVERSTMSNVYRRLLCGNSKEKAYFSFVWQMIKGDREFKTRLYPSLVSAIIMPAIFIGTILGDTGTSYFQETNILAYAPYFVALIIPITVVSIQFSSDYKASWLYFLSPYKDSSLIFRATFKALLMRIIVPIYLIISLVVTVVSSGLNLLILFNGLLIISIILFAYMYLTMKTLPFTVKYDAGKANVGCVTGILFVLLTVITIGISILIQFIPFGIGVTSLVLVMINIYIMNKGFSRKKLRTN